jgi:hypothetical protein
MLIRPKKWNEFQHYSRRNPPWIKLHRRMLDDFDFQCLPLASKALAPMLWLLCSEQTNATIDANPAKLAFRLRLRQTDVIAGLNPLIEAGFFEDASKVLASCLHDAIPERETEAETDTEIPSGISPSKPRAAKKFPGLEFAQFWLACPRKVGKGAARGAYVKAITKTAPETILAGMQRYARSRAGEPEEFTVHPATWLNQERWCDEASKANGAGAGYTRDPEVAAEEQQALKRAGVI